MSTTKRELVRRISNDTGLKQADVRSTVQAFLDQVSEALSRGDRLEFRGFGVFELRRHRSRNARNPHTGERLQLPERLAVKFKPSRLLKERLEKTPLSAAEGDGPASGGGEELEMRLQLRSREEEIEEAGHEIESALERFGLPEEEAIRFVFAVREALDNARRHGNGEDPQKEIDVRCLYNGGAVCVEIRDQGPGFDYEKLLAGAHAVSAVEAARERAQAGRHGGLGLGILLKACDEVRFRPPGNHLSLTKRLDAGA
jgi:nucleoid DNA-binding protein/anti-sigma regulatory factor (Ser/Thr protein kinase)